ncbi:aminotransferase class V-fold PLP-dependent enzyme [Streptomyces sp. CAU 1734]|uniref:aminotransferase class V-fold PLP-dependent enzyme n=1 Tax=Streptomyces sp. CAU 1734 TaxID=3140360 RepID=UPI00326173D5
METLGGSEFAPDTTYLNTAMCGLLPARAVTVMNTLLAELAAGRPGGSGEFTVLEAVRESFARIAGVGPERVAVGGSVSVHAGLIANSLPPGAEVLFPEGEYSSVVTPFAVRGDLRLRYAPLEDLAGAIRPGTALVAFSMVQSADGRIADRAAIRAAAAAHGTRTLVDASQSAGWLPLDAGEWDFTVTAGFKFLLCARGVSFLTVGEEAGETVTPIHAGPFAAADLWGQPYGPVPELAGTARRFDEAPAFLVYHGAQASLALLEEIGIGAVHAHATALARDLRDGVEALGHRAVPGESAIVALPGLGGRAAALSGAGIVVSERGGNLRLAFHLHNSAADVARVLEVLSV